MTLTGNLKTNKNEKPGNRKSKGFRYLILLSSLSENQKVPFHTADLGLLTFEHASLPTPFCFFGNVF